MTTASEPVDHCPYHTRQAFNVGQLPLITRWAEDLALKHRCDAIVACGHSGLIVAGALSLLTRLPVFAARKEGEKPVAAGGRMVSGIAPNGPAKRWLWIDDLIASGHTFRNSARFARNAGLIESPVPELVLLYHTGSQKYVSLEPGSYVGNDWGGVFGTDAIRGKGYHQYSFGESN